MIFRFFIIWLFSMTTVKATTCKLRPPESRNPLLKDFIQSITKAFVDQDAELLQTKFHKRLKITTFRVKQIMTRQSWLYGQPLSVKDIKTWKLDGSIHKNECDDIHIFSQLGYTSQWAVWLEIQGKKGKGIIFLPIIKEKEKLLLGGLHTAQWSFSGRDYKSWLQASKNSKTKEFSYIASQIAEKLLDGKHLYSFPKREVIAQKRLSLLSEKSFTEIINSFSPHQKIRSVQAGFSQGGPALIVHLELEKEIQGKVARASCENLQKSLTTKTQWFKEIEGIRCYFMIKNLDNRMGSIYVRS